MRISSETWNTISAEISTLADRPFMVESVRPVSGGDINQSFIISGHHDTAYFVKLNDAALLTMFEQEALALNRLFDANTVTVPKPLTYGVAQSYSYLVLSCHPIQSDGDYYILGQKLANLHRHTHSRHGWDHDNFIGTTIQKNSSRANWLEFWREQRLLPQFELAYNNGYSDRLSAMADQLTGDLPGILDGHEPVPSLLHGDLWGGNIGFVAPDQPILFDPASYYGDRETDLAMTELFGGFQAEFYAGYNETWPLPEGYERRKKLYQLYHMLNHLNLFGSSYLGSCGRLINHLLNDSG